MSVRDAIAIVLPDTPDAPPHWVRIVDGAMVQSGQGVNWLDACGLAALPPESQTALIVPGSLVVLRWFDYPDLAARQGQAAARLAALDASAAAPDTLFAAQDGNGDPARPHMIAVAARADMLHWLAWAVEHGIDPDLILPAPLLLPAPADVPVALNLYGQHLLRAPGLAVSGELSLIEALSAGMSPEVLPEAAASTLIAAGMAEPAINLRQGEFAKRRRMAVDGKRLQRIAVMVGLILLASLAISLITIIKYQMGASSLDRESLALVSETVPGASDPAAAEDALAAKLAQSGVGGYVFTGPTAGLFTALQATPNVSLTMLSRGPDGSYRAQLASANGGDINTALLALQSAGFTITATSSNDSTGRVLADITVAP